MTPKWIRLALPALIALTMSFGVASVAFADAHHPIANDDGLDPLILVDEDGFVEIEVLLNDDPIDSMIESFTQGANGTVVENEAGKLTYTPDANFNGEDSFEYTLLGGEGDDGTATVTVTVEPVGDAPVAVDDSAVTSEDTAVVIDVLANDTDVDGVIDAEAVTVALVSAATDGVAIVDEDTQEITYEPDTLFTGTDTFTYTVTDGDGTSNVATVTLSVGAHADLAIVKDVELGEGDAATFVITVVNAGPDDATNVIVTDTLAEGVNFVLEGSDGSYDEDTRVWTWTGDLAVDESVELHIEVTLDEPDAEVTNTVTVSSALPDANPDNNQDSMTLNPVDGPDFDACTGAENPSFAVICELLRDGEMPEAVHAVLMDVLVKMAGRTASGWYRNHGGDEDANLAAFCDRKPDHKRCPAIAVEGLDGDDDGDGKGKGKSEGKSQGKGPGGDDEDDD